MEALTAVLVLAIRILAVTTRHGEVRAIFMIAETRVQTALTTRTGKTELAGLTTTDMEIVADTIRDNPMAEADMEVSLPAAAMEDPILVKGIMVEAIATGITEEVTAANAP